MVGQRVLGAVTITEAEVVRGVVLEVGQRIVLLFHKIGPIAGELDPSEMFPKRALVGESEGIRRVLWEIHHVADLELPAPPSPDVVRRRPSDVPETELRRALRASAWDRAADLL
jgi:hypothetical protein